MTIISVNSLGKNLSDIQQIKDRSERDDCTFPMYKELFQGSLLWLVLWLAHFPVIINSRNQNLEIGNGTGLSREDAQK